MQLYGLPEDFWVVTRPTRHSELGDIWFRCTFERLMREARGGLQEKDIVGIYAEETEAKQAAEKLLREGLVKVGECLEAQVLVTVQVKPTAKDTTAVALSQAVVEVVKTVLSQSDWKDFCNQPDASRSIGIRKVELHRCSDLGVCQCEAGRRSSS